MFDTHQDEMEAARPPLLDRFLAILRNVVLDLFLLHERRQNGLVDRVIWKQSINDVHRKKQ